MHVFSAGWVFLSLRAANRGPTATNPPFGACSPAYQGASTVPPPIWCL